MPNETAVRIAIGALVAGSEGRRVRRPALLLSSSFTCIGRRVELRGELGRSPLGDPGAGDRVHVLDVEGVDVLGDDVDHAAVLRVVVDLLLLTTAREIDLAGKSGSRDTVS